MIAISADQNNFCDFIEHSTQLRSSAVPYDCFSYQKRKIEAESFLAF